jgi:transcription initiation factor IIE alpha subunit
MNTNFSAIQNSQNELIQTLSELSENISKNLKPNDEMLDIMKLTNSSLIDFNKKILNLNNDLEKVRLKNMEQAIQSELGKILTSLVNKDDKQNEQ